MKRTSMITLPLMAAAAVAWVACSDTPLGLREEPPPGETPPEVTPLEETPGAPVDAQIAFVRTRDGSPHIYLAKADGSPVTRLVAGERPAWSWDGRRIAFQRAGMIYVVNADGTNERRLATGSNPAWSPDDSRIVFDTEVGIFVLNVDTLT